MEKIINTLINSSVQGVDTYTHNDSTWLIFTESKQWVIELTGYQTLWYNYNFFKNIFAYVSLDAVQNQHLITKWVEDNVMNKVEHTQTNSNRNILKVEDTLQNGVKHTENGDWDDGDWLDDILQEGVRDTFPNSENDSSVDVEDTIQNGVRDTQSNPYENKSWIDGVIKKGVKETRLEQNITEGEVEEIIEDGVRYTGTLNWNRDMVVKHALEYGIKSSNVRQYVLTQIIDDIVENGVIETYDVDWIVPEEIIDETIESGVKETKKLNEGVVDWVGDIIDDGIKETFYDIYNHKHRVEGAIKNGVKEIKPLPAQTGNKDWSEYSHGREDRTKPFNDYLNDTLEMGVKIK